MKIQTSIWSFGELISLMEGGLADYASGHTPLDIHVFAERKNPTEIKYVRVDYEKSMTVVLWK